MADEFTKFAGRFPLARSEQPAGTTCISLEEFAAADLAVEQALNGDFKALIERLRNADALLPIERSLAAGIIAGKLRRPNHRPPDPSTQTKNQLLALNVANLMHDGMDKKRAVAETMKRYTASDSAVRKAMQAFAAFRVNKSDT
jgi:hypothetical protein